jgi:16S rRNA (adenine1518-N6/adenine1519-N6)-dimethyltransferase
MDVVAASVAAAGLTRNDTVLEVGPGAGVLTEALVRAAGHVVAVELDKDMLRVLAPLRREHANLELVEANVVSLPPRELVGNGPYKVVANLPYYISSAAIRHFLEAEHRPTLLVLLLQREVAERISAGPGDMGLLSLSVQVYARPEILRIVPATSFYPPPQVESALIRITLRERPVLPPEQLPTFFRLAQAGFSDRRKQLHNALRINLHLPPSEVARLLGAAGVDGKRRAETLSLAEWGRLVENLSPGCP